jgi:hypothetical protein
MEENGQPRESGSQPKPFDKQTIVGKRPLGRWQQPIDRIWTRTEEVEITSASVCLAANDQSAAARQSKPSASARPATTRATRSWSGLSTYAPARRREANQPAQASRTSRGSTRPSH